MAFKKGKKSRAELWNPNTIKRFRDEGRGRVQDRGEKYRPWLTVQDVPSSGISSRITGWKTGKRDVHLLSKLELYNFYTCLWDDTVVDFREQFPLDQDVTLRFAKEMGIEHPGAGPNHEPIVMTTDVRLTIRKADGHEKEVCRSIKPAGSWTFIFDDLLFLDGFVAKLRGQISSNDVSAWLMEQFTAPAQDQVMAFQGGNDPRLHQTLVRELNRIIKSGLIYTPELFSKVPISIDTWSAIKRKPAGHAVVRTNRLLLRDAFPFELTKTGPFNRLTARTRQKLELERRYWIEWEKLEWELVTESDIDLILARNVEALHPYYHLEPYGVSEIEKQAIARRLKDLISAGTGSLAEMAQLTDRDLKLPADTSLAVAKHLIIRKEWKVDLTSPFEPWRRVAVLN